MYGNVSLAYVPGRQCVTYLCICVHGNVPHVCVSLSMTSGVTKYTRVLTSTFGAPTAAQNLSAFTATLTDNVTRCANVVSAVRCTVGRETAQQHALGVVGCLLRISCCTCSSHGLCSQYRITVAVTLKKRELLRFGAPSGDDSQTFQVVPGRAPLLCTRRAFGVVLCCCAGSHGAKACSNHRNSP